MPIYRFIFHLVLRCSLLSHSTSIQIRPRIPLILFLKFFITISYDILTQTRLTPRQSMLEYENYLFYVFEIALDGASSDH